MGIKGLNQLLKSLGITPRRIPFSNYRGKRMAIDALYHIYAFHARGTFYDSLLEFMLCIVSNGIKPVFVFDGKCPDEKLPERELRRKKREALYLKIERLQSFLDNYNATGIVSEEFRTFVCERNCDEVDPKKINSYILRSQIHLRKPTDVHFKCMRELAEAFGLPVITADGEAEVACAKMCRDGLVDAVYTRDTDALACLSPETVVGRDSTNFFVVQLNDLLRKLSVNSFSFVDLCILCGTDFNPTIPRINSINAYELIKKYDTISRISQETNVDVSVLNHERVRFIFENENEQFGDLAWKPVNVDLVKEWLDEYPTHYSFIGIRAQLSILS